jgi:tetratricopeptide (TPR) repeat protein
VPLKRQLFRPGRRIEQIGKLAATPFLSRRNGKEPAAPASRDARRPLLARVAENAGALFSIVVSLVLLSVIVAFVLAFVKEIHRDALFLDPLDVPDDLVKQGYAPAVVTERVLDQLRGIQRIANTSKPRQGVDSSATLIDVQVPGGAVSMKSLVRYARNMLDLPETHITGEIVHEKDALSLTLRIRDRRTINVVADGLTATGVDDLTRQAAEAIVRATDPFVLASYVYVQEQATGKYDRTMRAIEYVLTHAPTTDDVWAWNLWGLILDQQGKTDEAIAKYRRSIAADSTVSPAYINLSRLLFKLGRRDEAQQVVARAEATQNPTAAMHNRIGDMYTQLLESDKALAAYRRALAIEPGNAYALAQIGGIYWQMRRYDDAERVLRDATKHHASQPAHLNYAGVLLDRGEVSAAREEIESARTFVQQPGQTAIMDAFIELLDRKFAEATESFARGIAGGDGVNPYAWWGWGRALAGEGRVDLAVPKYRKAIELYPVMVEAYADLGAALSAQGNADEALAQFAKGEAAGPRYARLYHEWGLALERAGRKEDAAAKHARAAALAAEQHVKW